jgi:hypothetical protein
MKELAGKVAVVTGGGSGIGRATSIALASAGASVVVAEIDDGPGEETVALITGAGETAAFLPADVTKWDDIERMVAFAEERFGGLDILHNNAGINAGWPRFRPLPAAVGSHGGDKPLGRDRGDAGRRTRDAPPGRWRRHQQRLPCRARHLRRGSHLRSDEKRGGCVHPLARVPHGGGQHPCQLRAPGLWIRHCPGRLGRRPEAGTVALRSSGSRSCGAEVAEAILELVTDESLAAR